jgi:hypothetical protein
MTQLNVKSWLEIRRVNKPLLGETFPINYDRKKFYSTGTSSLIIIVTLVKFSRDRKIIFLFFLPKRIFLVRNWEQEL